MPAHPSDEEQPPGAQDAADQTRPDEHGTKSHSPDQPRPKGHGPWTRPRHDEPPF